MVIKYFLCKVSDLQPGTVKLRKFQNSLSREKYWVAASFICYVENQQLNSVKAFSPKQLVIFIQISPPSDLLQKLDSMSLLRELCLSVYCTSSILENFCGNSCENGAHFNEQLFKKSVPTTFFKKYIYFFS